MTAPDWERFSAELCVVDSLGLLVDPSRMGLTPERVRALTPALVRAQDAMAALEAGALANPDEGRQVGHYWLRDPARAPDAAIGREIAATTERVLTFADAVHSGEVRGATGPFRQLVVCGIGGSALGPQFLVDALGGPHDRLATTFLDNTDPDGFDRVLGGLSGRLGETLLVVISKSGGTKETRNGMREAFAAWRVAGLVPGAHAVAVTGVGSELDRFAVAEGFLARFPMWDFVGGRTSITSAVGLLPAALLGADARALLAGARAMDEATRSTDLRTNPAALLALCWHHAGAGRGERAMVVLPYKDRLALLGRYLQQLVMESIGKERDLAGAVVHQGLTVYGNKGATDQHAYVQQLRDGRDDCFATFVEVLKDRAGASLEVEPGVTAGDYLAGFLVGTRRALSESGRGSLTITLPTVDTRSVGALIALFERAVGLYAAMIGVNAYHQPGVEAGKRAATEALALQGRVLAHLAAHGGARASAEEIAAAIGAPDEVETVWRLLEHAAANPDHGVIRDAGATPTAARYSRGAK